MSRVLRLRLTANVKCDMPRRCEARYCALGHALATVAVLALLALSAADTYATSQGELLVGYNGGPGLQTNLMVADFAETLPLRVRFGLGYTALAPGQSDMARRVFINDAENGVPEKRGWSWNYRFDLVYPLRGGAAADWFVFGGPRYSRFTANFKYVGGNEDFDISGRQWGFGGGLETAHAIDLRTSVVLRTGLDYYLQSPLYGHDTAYNPDGQHVNPRDGYDFTDADAAVEQPRLVTRLMAGLRHRF